MKTFGTVCARGRSMSKVLLSLQVRECCQRLLSLSCEEQRTIEKLRLRTLVNCLNVLLSQEQTTKHVTDSIVIKRKMRHKELRRWFNAHSESPYPTLDEKKKLCADLEISQKELDHWFINERNRRWKRRLLP